MEQVRTELMAMVVALLIVALVAFVMESLQFFWFGLAVVLGATGIALVVKVMRGVVKD